MHSESNLSGCFSFAVYWNNIICLFIREGDPNVRVHFRYCLFCCVIPHIEGYSYLQTHEDHLIQKRSLERYYLFFCDAYRCHPHAHKPRIRSIDCVHWSLCQPQGPKGGRFQAGQCSWQAAWKDWYMMLWIYTVHRFCGMQDMVRCIFHSKSYKCMSSYKRYKFHFWEFIIHS